jgi:hypothetical protein
MKVRVNKKNGHGQEKKREVTDMQQLVAEAHIDVERVVGAESKFSARNYALYRFLLLFFFYWD